MIAMTAQELPTSSSAGWAYEPKMDGFRLLAHRGTKRVALHSRQQRPLGLYFPEIVAALRQLDVEVVLDGELVLWRNGRLDFAGLQQRLHPAESRVRALSIATPASFGVFDVLALNGESLRSRCYEARRSLLEDLFARQLPHGLILMPMSTDLRAARGVVT
jgi:ATP-dependent DNA ligase